MNKKIVLYIYENNKEDECWEVHTHTEGTVGSIFEAARQLYPGWTRIDMTVLKDEEETKQ